MAERLVLHIGAPKTGTSAIQVGLSQYRELLGRAGVLYPEVDLPKSEQRIVGNGAFIAEMLSAQTSDQHRTGECGIGAFAQQVAEAKAATVLYSSELIFYRADARRVALLCEAMQRRSVALRVICMVRNYAEHAMSAYLQGLKRAKLRESLGEVSFDQYLRKKYRGIRKSIDLWAHAVGPESMDFLSYEKHRGNVLRPFLELLDVPAADVQPIRNVNTGVGAMERVLLEALANSDVPVGVIARINNRAQRGSASVCSNFRLTNGQKVLMEELFRSDVAWLNDRYALEERLEVVPSSVPITEEAACPLFDEARSLANALARELSVRNPKSNPSELEG